MAGFDPDVFGGSGGDLGFDPEVFGVSSPKRPLRPSSGASVANDAISQGARAFPGQGSDALGGLSQAVLNGLGGFVRGAGSIGATVARPFESAQDNAARRAGIDANMQAVGAQPDSFMYGAGKLGGEIAGTAPIGGILGKAVGAAAPSLAPIATAIETAGFRAPGLSAIPALGARMLGGGITGAASAAAVDPSQAREGFLIGSLLPPGVQLAGMAGKALSNATKSAARSMMQSAVKPTIAQLRSGDAATAIDTMLQYGISPNAKGVEKLQGLIDATDNSITQGIANSTATIDKANVLGPVLQTRAQFGSQVSPGSDLQAIDSAVSGFLNHPAYPGMALPVQDAQALKQGTYRVLAKKYGQLGSADTEAQKALARGLKDEIASAVPGVADANAQLSRLLATMSVAERRALMEGNKNPMGLSLLAGSKAGLLGFLADRSAALKALAARGMYSASDLPVTGLLDNPALVPYIRQGLLATEANP